MPYITSAQNNETPVKIYYEETGTGKSVVFIHGWPLNGAMWEYQMTELSQHGLRCITYDRRGFGKSDWPAAGYDYNTLAFDLKSLLDQLNLTDVTLVAFSMAGGEVAKYFSLHGGERVAKVVLISCVTPYMLKTPDNPDGVPSEVFDKMTAGILQDRPAFMEGFNKDFFGVTLINHPVSSAFLINSLTQVMHSSAIATIACAKAFATTDFRADVPKINVPVLIIHGDADKIVPIDATGDETSEILKDAKYIVYEGAPHGLWYTDKEKLNTDLLDFI